MERLTSASLREVLERVTPAISAGAVNVISVEAIRDRSGARWMRKREQVETFVERAFDRVSQPGDIIVALNDAEFVTIQPNATRAAAIGLSANLLKETLEFFLGAVARDDLRLFQVTAFVNGELSVERIDPATLMAEPEVATPPEASRTAALPPPAEAIGQRAARKLHLVSAMGLEVETEVKPEAAWNVSAKAVASFLLRPEVRVAKPREELRAPRRGEMSPNLSAEVAAAVLSHAANLIACEGVRVALHIPVPLSALTYSTSRYRLLHALKDMDAAVRQYLILEITELADGLPQGRLAELVGMLSPHARAVLARAPSEVSDLSLWRRCGLKGVTLDCSHLQSSDRNVQFRLSRFAQASSEVARACVGYGLQDRSLLFAAWASGFTHVSGPALWAEIGEPSTALRLGPVDLFAQHVRGAA